MVEQHKSLILLLVVVVSIVGILLLVLEAGSITGLLTLFYTDYDQYESYQKSIFELTEKQPSLQQPAPAENTMPCVKQITGSTFQVNPTNLRQLQLKFCGVGAEPTVCLEDGKLRTAWCGLTQGYIFPSFYPIKKSEVKFLEKLLG